ncbi:MAG: hypothetical protein GY866_00155, partial [Proteobacteria bacterium]|nr:hypothetical protein [Pseudomonadota bacterium]
MNRIYRLYKEFGKLFVFWFVILILAACGKVEDEAATSPENTITSTGNGGSITNSVPTISSIADQIIAEDTTSDVIAFTVSDPETEAGNLVMSASSSDITLIPNTNFYFGGADGSRTVSFAPATGKYGTVTITLTVSDGSKSASSSFNVTITSINDAPVISEIDDLVTNVDTTTDALSFTVSDAETAADDLTLTGSSNNTSIIPDANIVFGGSGENRTVTVTPSSGKADTVAITIQISDGVNNATESFILTIKAYETTQNGSILATATFGNESSAGRTGNDIVIKSNHTITWDGSRGPYTGDIQIESGGTLQITGSGGTISGAVNLAGGTLDIDDDASFDGIITYSAASTFDIATGKTMTYSGSAISINSNILTLAGTGTFKGNLILAGGTLDVNDSLTVSGNITQTASSTLDILAGKTFTYAGSPVDIGANTLTLSDNGKLTMDSTSCAFNLNDSSSILKVDKNGTVVQGWLTLAGGTLDVNEDATFDGEISHSNSSTIDISTGKILTYTGSTLKIGAATLSLYLGQGSTLANDASGDLVLDNAGSILKLTSHSSVEGSLRTVSRISVDGADLTSGMIDLDEDYTISTLTLGTYNSKFSLASEKELTVSSELMIETGKTLTLSDSGTILVKGNVALNGTIDFSTSATLDISNSNTFTVNGAVNIGSGTLRLVGSTLLLGSDLRTSGGTLYTTNTDLTLAANAILTSSQAIWIDTLNLGNNTLTLGSNTSDMTISSVVDLDNPSKQIITNLADLTLSSNLNMTDGTISSTWGDIKFKGTVSGGTVNFGGGTNVQLNGNLNFAPTALTTASTTWNTGANTLALAATSQFDGDIVLAGGTININESMTIDGTVYHTADSTIDVATSKTLTYSGDELDINAFTLNLSGPGNINNTNALDLNTSSSALKIDGAGSIIQGPVKLGGGTLNVNESTTISGAITHIAGSTIDVATGKILTYGGTAVNLGAFSLTLPGVGTIANTNAFNLNDGASVLKIDGATSTIQGPVVLGGGTLDVNESATIGGAITHTANSTLDVAVGKTLTYGGAAVDLGAYTLTLPGEGTIANTNTFNLNNGASVLKIDGAGSTIQGPVALSGGTLDVNENTTIAGDLTHTASSTVDVTAGKILTYAGAAVDLNAFSLILSGVGTIANANAVNLNDGGSVLKIDGLNSTIQGPVVLGGGTLDVNESTTINGVLTHTAGSAIDVASGKTLIYAGAALDLGAFTLTLPGAGTVANTNAVNLNDGSSVLKIDGLNGTIQGPVVLGGGALDINESAAINGALTHTSGSTIDVAAGKTLT